MGLPVIMELRGAGPLSTLTPITQGEGRDSDLLWLELLRSQFNEVGLLHQWLPW